MSRYKERDMGQDIVITQEVSFSACHYYDYNYDAFRLDRATGHRVI